MFPQTDARGPAEVEFVRQEIKRTEQRLAEVDLAGGGL
jgi:hypothetical protein